MGINVGGRKYILVFGASVVDIFGFCGKAYKEHDSIPGSVKMSFGGVSRNIAENMGRIGLNVKFISILGNDESGRGLMENARKIGYDMEDSLVVENKRTPTYMAILNEKGEMVSAVADMDLLKEMNREFIDSKSEIFKNADYTFVDADDAVTLEYVLESFHKNTKFILDPISVTKANAVKHLMKYFHTVKPNRVEAEALVGFPINSDEDLKRAGEYLLNQGVQKVFISLDEDGIYYADGNSCGKVKALDVIVKNVTGAGDSFVAGLGYSYAMGLPLLESVKFSMTMSIITISHNDSIHPEISYDMIMETKKNIKWVEKTF